MKLTFLFLVFLGLGACGTIKVQQVANSNGSVGKPLTSKSSGVRFYRPAMHVWIVKDTPSSDINISTLETKDTKTTGIEKTQTDKVSIANAGYKTQIVYLPDYSQEYIVTWKRGLIGSVNPKFTLTDGWNLTGFESEINTGVTLELSASAAIGGGAISTDPKFKGPGLYKLDFDPQTKSFKLGELVLSVN